MTQENIKVITMNYLESSRTPASVKTANQLGEPARVHISNKSKEYQTTGGAVGEEICWSRF